MVKERLTAKAVKSDLLQIINDIDFTTSEWRIAFIIPTAILAIFFGFILQSVIVGLVIAIFPAYHTVRFIMEIVAVSKVRRGLMDGVERGEISVCRETLSHIAQELIYEPHSSGRHASVSKEVKVFYFQGGSSWRLRPIFYYSWSETFRMSPTGLCNTSVQGDEFYVIRLQEQYEVACVYNTKMFEWEEDKKSV